MLKSVVCVKTISQIDFFYYLFTGKLYDSTSVLTLTPTKDDDGKTFECQATNMALTTPRNATITLDVQCKFKL